MDLSKLSSCLPFLTATVVQRARRQGIHSVSDVHRLQNQEIQELTLLNEDQAAELKQFIVSNAFPKLQSAQDELDDKMGTSMSIGTQVPGLDELLGGSGFRSGRIYELYGGPGVGKSQLAWTLASEVLTSKDKMSSVVLLDSKCDFSILRLEEIMRARTSDLPQDLTEYLDNFHYKRVFDLSELGGTLQSLVLGSDGTQSFCKATRLLIIDSLASIVLPLMRSEDKLPEIFGGVANVICLLRKIAFHLNTCVLVINHSAWKSETQSIQPSLGKMFSNGPHVRLFMEKEDKIRTLTLQKCIRQATGAQCRILVSAKGIDVCPN